MKTFWILLSCLLLAAGCASYSGRGLAPGASAEQVRGLMGEPAATYADAQGGQVWAYPRGPIGLETYMARISSQGSLTAIDQVLGESWFMRLRPGVDRQQDVLRMFGPYWLEARFERQKELVWTWRFRNHWGNPAQFHVTFDEAGLVKRWEQIEEDKNFRRWIVD
jgi:hypothetical protein